VGGWGKLVANVTQVHYSHAWRQKSEPHQICKTKREGTRKSNRGSDTTNLQDMHIYRDETKLLCN
jgi:hypothetical protein